MSNPKRIEDLLKLAEVHETKVKPTERDLTEVNQFLHDNPLVSGDDHVESDVLFYFYLKWKRYRPKGKRKPITRSKFFKDLSEHFDKKKYSTNGVYSNKWLIDMSSMGLYSKEDYDNMKWEARRYYSREKIRNARKKRKEQKAKENSKTSLSKKRI